MAPKIETKNAPQGVETLTQACELKMLGDEGEFEGYASLFDVVDQGNDKVVSTAFTKNAEEWKQGRKLPRLLWQHDPSEVIGVWTEATVDAKGLRVKGRLLLDLPKAREAHTLIKHDAISGLSIGYRTKESERDSKGVRLLKDLDLMEISVVTFPMLPEANITGVKKLHSIRDVEQILRDAGVPNAFARLVATKGYDAAVEETKGEQPGADSEATEALKRLQKSLNELKEKLRA